MGGKSIKVLVTGGAGFIGSHLCEALVNHGAQVVILDNLSSGNKDNCVPLVDSRKAQMIVGDCANPAVVRRASYQADTIFHLSANPEVRLELNDPKICFRENVYATHVLLETVKKDQTVTTIIFASSSTVYGEPNIIPTPEDYAPLEPISIYAGSKLASEALVSSYCHTYRKQAVILRLANVVGRRSRHGIVSDFVAKLRRNPSCLEILGDGQQSKSYLHIDDCVDAMVKASKAGEATVEVFNVGSDDRISSARIAEIVVEEMDLKDVRFEFTGTTWAGDVTNMLLDTTKLRSIGWRPRYHSEESIRLATKTWV